MPGFDKTGPQGSGPLTGRGLGRCRSSEDISENQTENRESRSFNAPLRNGFGRGAVNRRGNGCRNGRGRGFRNRGNN